MNIEDLSIEDLVKMRDQLVEVLADKVQARQRELSSEAERLAGLIASKTKPKALNRLLRSRSIRRGTLRGRVAELSLRAGSSSIWL